MSIFLRSFWATVSLGLAVSVMIGLVLSPGTIRANANEPPQFSLQWDSSGSSIDLATDSLGNVYALGYSGQIEKFDSNGTFITNWGSQATGGISAPNGGFYFPESIAADSENNVYVADTGNHRIQKFDSNGTFITKWGGSGNADGRFQFPQGIAVDSENNVYVADTENNRIQKFDSNGTFITKWGSEVVEGEEFMPRSLTVSDNHVFSTNYSNNTINKFNTIGTFITKWGSEGSADGQFIGVGGITSDQAGSVYVLDTGNHRIQKFDSNGTFITKWGSEGSAEGQFMQPAGISIFGDRVLYVSDNDNNRIQKFVYPEVEPPVDPSAEPTVIPNATDGKSIVMTSPEGSRLSQLTAISPRTITQDDQGAQVNDYPLGLVSLELNEVDVGATVPVELFFETSLSPDEVTARKYFAKDSSYSDLPGATVLSTKLGDKTGLRVNYQIKDGGDLDQDGVANGTIVDPVGLAVKRSPELVNTGAVTIGIMAVGIVLVVMATWTYIDYRRHKRPLMQADPYLASSYTYLHHIRVVTVPALRYRLQIRFEYVEKIAVR